MHDPFHKSGMIPVLLVLLKSVAITERTGSFSFKVYVGEDLVSTTSRDVADFNGRVKIRHAFSGATLIAFYRNGPVNTDIDFHAIRIE